MTQVKDTKSKRRRDSPKLADPEEEKLLHQHHEELNRVFVNFTPAVPATHQPISADNEFLRTHEWFIASGSATYGDGCESSMEMLIKSIRSSVRFEEMRRGVQFASASLQSSNSNSVTEKVLPVWNTHFKVEKYCRANSRTSSGLLARTAVTKSWMTSRMTGLFATSCSHWCLI